MLTRRIFLQSTALVLTLPAGRGVRAAIPTDAARIRVISDLSCSDGRRFHRGLATPAVRVGVDEGAYLQGVAADLNRHAVDYLLGLTQNSDFILLRQSLYESGFRMIYQGQHHYEEDVIRHSFQADSPLLEELTAGLAADQRPWSRFLAETVPHWLQSRGPEDDAFITTPGRRPADSRGFLLSWAFARERTA
ncbi:MAG: hypothetical protein P8126_00415 [Gammaproteobacteria bacterium]|jgi:hypothetical protein